MGAGRVSDQTPSAAVTNATPRHNTAATITSHEDTASVAGRRPPGARLRPGDDAAQPCSPSSCGAGATAAGAAGAGGAGAAGTGGAPSGAPGAGAADGTLTLKPLMIASVASAAATTWSTLVVTASETR